jgi:serine/threonine protein kinase
MASTFRHNRSIPVRAARADTPAQRAPTQFPGRLGSWELVGKIGGGEFANVYRARIVDGSAGQPAAYALKVLRDEWQDDPRGLAMLVREVQVAACVTHSHLVPILAASLERQPFYLAMPYLEGHSLAEYLATEASLDLPAIFWFVRQVAEATLALEAGGWMHGDVKPGNIIVSLSGHATLFDLGFAVQRGARASIADRPVVGTLSYMAPEILYSASGGNSRSDVYSLGVMLFPLLTGRLPFDADDIAELALQHRQEIPGDVRKLAPQVPMRAARLVRQMLSKEPLRRPSPGELVQRLIALEIETFAERLACEAA